MGLRREFRPQGQFVREIYDETNEVPIFDMAEELVEKIIHFLPLRAPPDGSSSTPPG